MSSKLEFCAELAPSARAKCKGCKEALPKDMLRVGVKQVLDADRAEAMEDRARAMAESVQWYHPRLTCLGSFRKTAKWWIANTPLTEEVVGFESMQQSDKEMLTCILDDLREGRTQPTGKEKAKGKTEAAPEKTREHEVSKRYKKDESSSGEDNSSEISGSGSASDSAEQDEGSGEESNATDTDASPQAKRQLIDKTENTRKQKKTRKDSTDSSSASDGNEQTSDSNDDENDKNVVNKHTKTHKTVKSNGEDLTSKKSDDEQSLDAVTADKIRIQADVLTKKNLTQLKEMLRTNKQVISGTKDVLVNRIANCKVLGCPPKCPDCGAATLRFNASIGVYSCPGHYDDGTFMKCKFRSEGPVTTIEWREP